MRVNEIFRSVQGEGFHVGVPATFIRFAGCNRQCPWCDTDHVQGHELTPQAILGQPKVAAGNGIAVLTGGEPLLQPAEDLRRLVDGLRFTHNKVAFETNGDLLPGHWLTEGPDSDVWLTCSPKDEATAWELLERLGKRQPDEWKLVIGTEAVSEIWSKQAAIAFIDTVRQRSQTRVYLSPVFRPTLGLDQTALKAAVEVVEHFGARTIALSVQIHKLIGVR